MDEPVDLSELLDLQTAEKVVQQKVADYCRIDLQHLETALSRQPSLFAYVSSCYEMAKVNETMAKWDMEHEMSRAFQVLSDQDAKASVSAIEKKIKMVPSVEKAVGRYHEALKSAARLRALINGLEHRRDMLIQLSARERAERYSN